MNVFVHDLYSESACSKTLLSLWKFTATTHSERHLLRVPKQSLHLWDADAAEITLPRPDTQLASLATQSKTIRRMLNLDSLETEYSVRIYKQSKNSMEYHAFLTRHISGQKRSSYDGRRLVNIFSENLEGIKENFAEKLASHGSTLSYDEFRTKSWSAIDSLSKSVEERWESNSNTIRLHIV